MEEHPVVPERTEPWRLLTEKEKNAWNTLSPEERDVCDALVHRLHRELGYSDIRGMVDSLRQNRAHPTVLAVVKLMHCTGLPGECQNVISSCDQWKGHGTWEQSCRVKIFYWKHPLKEVHVKGTLLGGCLFKSGL